MFLCLTVIHYLSDSYFEPKLADTSLATSPFFVLLAVAFKNFLWGISDVFIGISVIIALTILATLKAVALP